MSTPRIERKVTPPPRRLPSYDSRNLPGPAKAAPQARPAIRDTFEHNPIRIQRGDPQHLGANLQYGGGPILSKPRVVPIYSGSYWNTRTGRGDRAYFDGFNRALVKNPGFNGVLSQYGVGKGSVAPSVQAGNLPKTVYQRDVENLVRGQLAKGKYGPNNVYTVYLPPGHTLIDGNSGTSAVGGFHSTFTGPNGKPVYYSVVNYACGGGSGFTPGSQAARDNTTIASSHEYAEAATDPQANGSGYYDHNTRYTLQGKKYQGKAEIGDIPTVDGGIVQHTPGYGGTGAPWVRSGRYAYQELWSNRDHRVEASPVPGRASPATEIAQAVLEFGQDLFLG